MESEQERIYQFTGKYQGSGGPIGKYLVAGFFRAVTELIPADVEGALEVACGAGYSTERIHRARPDLALVASDLGVDLVALASARVPAVPMRVESVYQLSHGDESFDLIVALEVLEHLKDPRRALIELHRVTRRHLLLSVPREPLWRVLNMARGRYMRDFGNTPGHLNHWSTTGIVDFVAPWFRSSAVLTPLPWTILLLTKRPKDAPRQTKAPSP